MNRIRTLASSLVIALACSHAAAVRDEVSKDFDAEYARIVKMIDYYSSAHKLPASKRPPPAEQSLDMNSRILKTDRNPLDVALRRADALLKRLKSVPDAPKLDKLTARQPARRQDQTPVHGNPLT